MMSLTALAEQHESALQSEYVALLNTKRPTLKTQQRLLVVFQALGKTAADAQRDQAALREAEELHPLAAGRREAEAEVDRTRARLARAEEALQKALDVRPEVHVVMHNGVPRRQERSAGEEAAWAKWERDLREAHNELAEAKSALDVAYHRLHEAESAAGRLDRLQRENPDLLSG